MRNEILDKAKMMIKDYPDDEQRFINFSCNLPKDNEVIDPLNLVGHKPNFSNIPWIRGQANRIKFAQQPVLYYDEVIKPISC